VMLVTPVVRETVSRDKLPAFCLHAVTRRCLLVQFR
jgi:hypothetical protein